MVHNGSDRQGWRPRRLGKVFVCGVILLSVVLVPKAWSQTSVRDLGRLLSHCTAEHGYSVAEGKSLKPYELGAGEGDWRDCVYDGIRVTVMPNAPFPDLYEALIKDDQALTAGIRAKQVTRAQRSTRNLAAIKQIQARETGYLVDREKRLQQEAKTDEAIRETQRILDLQERLLEIRRAALEGLR